MGKRPRSGLQLGTGSPSPPGSTPRRLRAAAARSPATPLLPQPDGFDRVGSPIEGLHPIDLGVADGQHVRLVVADLAPAVLEAGMGLLHDDDLGSPAGGL